MEAYQHFTALRDVELRERHQSFVAQWQSSLGGTTPLKESHSPVNSGSGARTQAKPAQHEGPTQYVELVHTTSGEVIELYGSGPCQPKAAAGTPQPTLSVRERAELFVADQLPGFGRR